MCGVNYLIKRELLKKQKPEILKLNHNHSPDLGKRAFGEANNFGGCTLNFKINIMGMKMFS